VYFAAVQAFGQIYTVSTLTSLPTGVKPLGVVVHPDGRLFVSATNHALYVISPAQSQPVASVFAGVPGTAGYVNSSTATSARFRNPMGLSIDPTGQYLYLADGGNHCIRKLDLTSGAVSTLAGSASAAVSGYVNGSLSEARFNNPSNVLAVSSSVLYVADNNNHKIRTIDLNTGEVYWLAGAGPGLRNGAGDFALFTLSGLAGMGTTTMNGKDYLFFSEGGNHRIRRVLLPAETSSLTSEVVTLLGRTVNGSLSGNSNGPDPQAQINRPAGIAIAGKTLYLSPRDNHRIRSLPTNTATAESAVTTDVAGDPAGTSGGLIDGIGADARFNSPQGIAYDENANVLYLADVENQAIRKIEIKILPPQSEYYVATNGDDANPGTVAAPWKTLERVQAILPALEPGNKILFRRGDTFRGSVTAIGNINGSSEPFLNNPIIIGAYANPDGSDNSALPKPVISGMEVIGEWRPNTAGFGADVFEATVPENQPVTALLFNHSLMPVSRYPALNNGQGGYALLSGGNQGQPLSGGLGIADDELAGKPDNFWTGSIANVRQLRFNSGFRNVVSSSGNEINFAVAPNSGDWIKGTGWGYYLINVRELDEAGEWFYDASVNKVYLKSPTGQAPAAGAVEVSRYASGFSFSGPVANIRFQDLDFRHQRVNYNDVGLGPDSNQGNGLLFTNVNAGARDITIARCDFRHSRRALNAEKGRRIKIVDNTIFDCMQAIRIPRAASCVVENSHINTITFNQDAITIGGSALLPTSIYSLATNTPASVSEITDWVTFGCRIVNNTVENCIGGGIGLLGGGSIPYDETINETVAEPTVEQQTGHLLENNILRNLALLYDDVAGINVPNNNHAGNNSIIRNNIVRDVRSSLYGIPSPFYANGLYFDTNSRNVHTENNTFINCDVGIYVHASIEHQILHNNIYNCPQAAIKITEDNLQAARNMPPWKIEKLVLKGNKLYSADQGFRPVLYVQSRLSTIKDFFQELDNNYYCNPYDSLQVLVRTVPTLAFRDPTQPWQPTASGAVLDRIFDLEGWQRFSGKDQNSQASQVAWKQYRNVVPGEELISNGDFSVGIDGWSSSDPRCQLVFDASQPALDGGAMAMQFNDPDLVAASSVRSPSFSVSQGQLYQFSGSLLTNELTPALPDNVPPGGFSKALDMRLAPLGRIIRYVPADLTRKDFSFIFSSDISHSDLRLELVPSAYDNTIWVDNISLKPVSAQSEDVLAKSPLFVNETAAPQNFPLVGSFKTLDGITVTGSVTVPAFSSVILVRDCPSPPAVTVMASPASVDYGQTTTLTTQVSGGVAPYSYDWNTGSADRELTTPALTRNSSYTVTVYDALGCSATTTVGVLVTPPYITFAPLEDKTYGDGPITLVATASSGLPVSFTVESGPAELSGNELTLTGAGEVTIKASQAGDDYYPAAPDVTRKFTVHKASQTITFQPMADVVYRSNPLFSFGLTGASASSDLPVSYSVVSGPATLQGSLLTITGIGTVTLKASQPGNQNYLAGTAQFQSFSVITTDKDKGVKPILECVVDNGNGQWTARFGYKNDMDMLVYIPAGATNYLTPTSGAVQIVDFQPGRTQNAFTVSFPANGQVSWSVAGPDSKLRTATATTQSPGCATTARQGVEEVLTRQKLVVYPNPTADEVEVVVPGHSQQEGQLRLYSVQGHLISQQWVEGGEKYRLSLKEVPAGSYLIRIVVQDQVWTNVLIKQ
jgi:parallel beta-helix repeat protein